MAGTSSTPLANKLGYRPGHRAALRRAPVRELALPLGLVDIKVCAVDEVWSGLLLVLRKELRPS